MPHRIATPPPPTTTEPPRRWPGTWSTLVAVAAAVGIVATLAWVIQTIPHARVAGKTGTSTPDPTAHITTRRGRWSDVVQYTRSSSNDSLIVWPSNPQIAFRITREPLDATASTLARTTDGGATWTKLPMPTDDGGWLGSLDINPLDLQTVFLTLDSDQSNPHCPAYALPAGVGADAGPSALQATRSPRTDTRLGPLHPTGGYACYFQYVSRDGGAHWSHPTFPWPAQHLADGVILSTPLQTQGSTLFTALFDNLNGEAYAGVRLAASADGGSTWSAADSDIFATGQIVTSYTAIPATTNLYAVSVPQRSVAGQVPPGTLWRSDDAGAHWSQVGTVPVAQATLIGAVVPGFGSILYAAGATVSTTGAASAVYASRDGGQTWSQAPSAGQPNNPYGTYAAYATPHVLADGSLLLDFFDFGPYLPDIGPFTTNATFYAWRPGDPAWFQVVPGPGGDPLMQMWLATPVRGPQTLWIVVAKQQDAIYSVLKCVLQ